MSLRLRQPGARLLTASATSIAIAWGANVSAATPSQIDELLASAAAAIAETEYEAALEKLALARAQIPSGDPRHATLELRTGLAYASLGRSQDAAAAFDRAVALDPGVTLGPDVSPKILAQLTAAKDRARRAQRRQPMAVTPDASPTAPTSAATKPPPAWWQNRVVGVSATSAGAISLVGTGVLLLLASSDWHEARAAPWADQARKLNHRGNTRSRAALIVGSAGAVAIAVGLISLCST